MLTLAALDLEAAAPEIIAVLQTTPDPADAGLLWRGLLKIEGAGAMLAQKLPDARLPAEVARAGLRPAREGNRNEPLVQALMKIAGLSLANVQLSPTELQALAAKAIAHGDAARGEQVYRRPELACIACHAIGGAGGKAGPDLTSIGASAPPDYLIESLPYPNTKIKEGYHSILITTRDQQIVSGILISESDGEVVVRDAANEEISIATANIADRGSVGSLMPAGLIDTLLPEERLDLVKFLSRLGEPGPYDASKGGVARFWRLYLADSRNTHLGFERVLEGDFTLPGWQPAFSLVSGVLPQTVYDAAFQIRHSPRGLFLATQFKPSRGGPVTFTLRGEAKDAWINGKTVEPAGSFTVDAAPGVNTLVLGVDAVAFPAGLSLESDDVTFLNE